MNQISQRLISNGSSYFKGVFGIAQRELKRALRTKQIQTLSTIAVSLLLLLAVAWLSILAALIVSDFWSMKITAITLFSVMSLAALITHYVTEKSMKKSRTESLEVIERALQLALGKATAPIKNESDTEKETEKETEKKYFDQIQTSQASLVKMSRGLQTEVIQLLSPARIAKKTVINNPLLFLIGGVALGLMVGINNTRDPQKSRLSNIGALP